MRKSKTCAAKWARLRERMAHEISELRERMAKLEGLLEGLREASPCGPAPANAGPRRIWTAPSSTGGSDITAKEESP